LSDSGANRLASLLLSELVCPRCRAALHTDGSALRCAEGHAYPVVEGVPVLLLPEKRQTQWVAAASYQVAMDHCGAPFYISTLGGLSSAERARLAEVLSTAFPGTAIDPVISYLLATAAGHGYAELAGEAMDYPIPRLPLPPEPGQMLLDIGCNWGRWAVAAARQGWRVVGLDPSLGAVLAGRRTFGGKGDITFICGDARFLPFRDDSFRSVFSYSVLQHFSDEDLALVATEIRRVLQPHGQAKIQMAHSGGLRARYSYSRPEYSRLGAFRVRYRPLADMSEMFAKSIGPTTIKPEAFGGLGLLEEHWRIVSLRAKILIVISAIAKRIARVMRPLIRFADSVYVVSVKR
jgi:SAM-dependent methyltransferase/uncharacterized protein YbaR (Trm112 family)